MADIRGSVVNFLQRTKAKFDYYAGGQFLRKQETKIAQQRRESPPIKYKDPPRKPKRKRSNVLAQSNPRARPPLERIPISPSPPRTSELCIFSPVPKRKRTLLTKPSKSRKQAEPAKVNSPSRTQGVQHFLDTRNHEDKDQAIYLQLFKKSVRTYKPPGVIAGKVVQKPRAKIQTFEIVDGDGDVVEKCEIFRDSNKFYGNMDKLSKYEIDSKDNDIQTSYDEMKYGEKRGAKVLARTIRELSGMQVHELSVDWRTQQVLQEEIEE